MDPLPNASPDVAASPFPSDNPSHIQIAFFSSAAGNQKKVTMI
jgi:hypothetical protein